MHWTITYYSERVRLEIESLPVGIRASYARFAELLEEFGLELGMPHARSMGKGLYELRPRGREGIARVFYCSVIGKEIIVLHSFIKKTDKTPRREMEIALKRLAEVKRNG